MDIWYYGSRYAKACHPSDLWITYFTSSREVKTQREYCGEPDIIQVRRQFNTIDKCRLWEHKVLRRIKAVSKPNWLNKHIGGEQFCCIKHSEKTKKLFSKIRRGRPKSIAHKSAIKNALKGRKSPFTGKKHTEEWKQLASKRKLGKPRSLETKIKISQTRKQKFINGELQTWNKGIKQKNYRLT